MSNHRVYSAIIAAVRKKRLIEPFDKVDFRAACSGFAAGTYQRFLHKHERGNGETSELFVDVGSGKYRLLRPLLYGLSDKR